MNYREVKLHANDVPDFMVGDIETPTELLDLLAENPKLTTYTRVAGLNMMIPHSSIHYLLEREDFDFDNIRAKYFPSDKYWVPEFLTIETR